MAVSYYYYTAEPAEGQKLSGDGAISNTRYLMDQILLLILPKVQRKEGTFGPLPLQPRISVGPDTVVAPDKSSSFGFWHESPLGDL